jgi:VWFA-related protein
MLGCIKGKIGAALISTIASLSPLLIGAGGSGTSKGTSSAAVQPLTSQKQFTFSDNVDLVLLDVSVKKPGGGFVTGLQKSNFHVTEDGQPREISQFASVDTPVTVGLVVDNSGSMQFKRPEVVTAGLAFAKESNPQDEFFVVNFNNSVERGLPADVMFTDDLALLKRGLYYGRPMGQTALYDAVAYALAHLEYSRRDKRTLIVVSDGGDNVSKTTLPELMKLIEASRATIYAVGLYDPEDHELNPSVLKKMATVSGGEFFEPKTLDEIIPTFHKIAQDIRNCYTIGYIPDEVNDKRVVRNVKVTADRDGRRLIVHSRTVYMTTPLSELLAVQNHQDNRGQQ